MFVVARDRFLAHVGMVALNIAIYIVVLVCSLGRPVMSFLIVINIVSQ